MALEAAFAGAGLRGIDQRDGGCERGAERKAWELRHCSFLQNVTATIRVGRKNGSAMFLDDAARAGKWFLMFLRNQTA
jgi:hypothetical protein